MLEQLLIYLQLKKSAMIDLDKIGVVEMSKEQQKEVSGGFMWGLFFLVALGTRILLDMLD